MLLKSFIAQMDHESQDIKQTSQNQTKTQKPYVNQKISFCSFHCFIPSYQQLLHVRTQIIFVFCFSTELMMAFSVPPTLKILSSVIRHGPSKPVKSLHLSSTIQRYCNTLVFAHRPVISPAPVTVTTVTNFHTSLVCHKKKKKEKPKKSGKKQTSTAYDDEEDGDVSFVRVKVTLCLMWVVREDVEHYGLIL